jgi:hypothetical protein
MDIRRGRRLRAVLAGSLLTGGLTTFSLAATTALTTGTASATPATLFSSTTAGSYAVTVPGGVTSVTITAVGGTGSNGPGGGGEGAIVTSIATVAPGDSLTVTVGADGGVTTGGSGAGSGGSDFGGPGGGGGGGGSAVFDRSTPLVVAGGGGGGGAATYGGNADQNGGDTFPGSGGKAGTLSGPGTGGFLMGAPFERGQPGSGMDGGDGGGPTGGGGGGGGGGYTGGGGGAPIGQYSGGGGGGSSYPSAATQWDTTATPSVTITIPPTTSVIIPSNGATLSGTAATLDATASNATSVEFRLFGGIYGYSGPVIGTATLTLYGWLYSWDTTTVPNGSYALLSEAFGSGGSAFSSHLSITVNNAPPPTTSVIIPSNGATLSGTAATLDAAASNATSVEFWLFGGSYGYSGHLVGTATPTLYGWLYSWDTTTVPNGSYALLSEAFGSGGSAFSSHVSITVTN